MDDETAIPVFPCASPDETLEFYPETAVNAPGRAGGRGCPILGPRSGRSPQRGQRGVEGQGGG